MSRFTSFALSAVVLTWAALANAADMVSGSWQISFENAQGPPIETVMKLKQTGEAVSGTIPGVDGSDVTMKGTLKGKTLELNYSIDFGQGPVAIKLTGTVDADGYSGIGDYGALGTGKFAAKRDKS